MPTLPRPFLVLAILDGWGSCDQIEGNAIAACPSDCIRHLSRRYPSTLLRASGAAVGLPDRVMGNSEVGHLTLGAGRVIEQNLTLINKAIQNGHLEDRPVLEEALNTARATGATVHFLGLASAGGVHSHLSHLRGLARLADRSGVARIRVHAFTDGRDTPPRSALPIIKELQTFLQGLDTDAAIATLGGRYYAMDRDRRWPRVEKAWRAMVMGEGRRAASGLAAVEAAYAREESDEFIQPTVVDGVAGGCLTSKDVAFFFNFRPDRARQMTRALTEDRFNEFPRPRRPDLARFVCMTPYDATFKLPVAFTTEPPKMTLGKLFSMLDATQYRIAETEKYAHVTYFLNGGVEGIYPGEERHLVPSPRIATYDLQPAMSAVEITARVVQRIHAAETDVIVFNLANADMVGHTGQFEATVKACQVVDGAVGEIHAACRQKGSLLVVTADHGNAEQMFDPATGQPHTAHTTHPVPGLFIRDDLVGVRLASGGGLASILPTILKILNLAIPAELNGPPLL